MIDIALPDLAAWTQYLRNAPIPVLDATATEIAMLAAAEEAGAEVAPQQLAAAASGDPLMTIRIFIDAARRRRASQVTDAESVISTIVLMGTSRFFREYTQLTTLERHLHNEPGAYDGLMRVLQRSHRAARFALGFAVHRNDDDANAIYDAALLHDFAELLLWCHAPRLAMEIRRRQSLDDSLRSADIQMELLNCTLDELQHALMLAWRLPELLADLTDETDVHPLRATQRRMVQLAVRVARHTADRWQNPALHDDVHDLAQLLNLSPGPTLRMLHAIDE